MIKMRERERSKEMGGWCWQDKTKWDWYIHYKLISGTWYAKIIKFYRDMRFVWMHGEVIKIYRDMGGVVHSITNSKAFSRGNLKYFSENSGGISRLCVSNTIEVRIQADFIEAQLCGDLWIFFMVHLSWCKNLITAHDNCNKLVTTWKLVGGVLSQKVDVVVCLKQLKCHVCDT